MPGKLGRTSKERAALLRNQASQLLWYGKIETTAAKAKELKSYVEKLITKAVNTYDDNIEFEVTEKDKKGKEIKVTNIKGFNEKKSAYKARTADVQHPLMDKLFNELAPKYAARKEEKGQGGGYTRIYLLGERRGDAAETAIIELV